MKYLLLLTAVSSLCLTCCQRSVPPVPEERQVVLPKGSTDIEKAWGGITPKEGDAVLGPLSNMRR